jgi:hypothetical protein
LSRSKKHSHVRSASWSSILELMVCCNLRITGRRGRVLRSRRARLVRDRRFRRRCHVERHVEGTGWEQLATIAPDGNGSSALRGSRRDAGNSIRLSLELHRRRRLAHTAEAWVDVPVLARFAHRGCDPNPAPGRNLRVHVLAAERAAGTARALRPELDGSFRA